LRRHALPHGAKIVVIANKYEVARKDTDVCADIEKRLGFGAPIEISAEHGEGLSDLYKALAQVDIDTEQADVPQDTSDVQEPSKEEGVVASDGRLLELAIVGRPNVGKSTLLNQLIGDERVVTGPMPGITRDAIAVSWEHSGQRIRLVDTAGLRRPVKVTDELEEFASADTIRVLRYVQVVTLVLDAQEHVSKYELTLARRCIEEGRALVVIANKMDLITNVKKYLEYLNSRFEVSLAQARGVPILPISAKTGRGVDKVMPLVLKTYAAWCKRISTSLLNRWLADITARKPPPMSEEAGNVRLKLRYITQVKSRPPTFAVFFSKGKQIPEDYVRYLTNGLKDEFGLGGIPIRILARRIKKQVR